MNVHDAICRAADHVEQPPERFEFSCGITPGKPQDFACALGWVSYFLGHRDGSYSAGVNALKIPGTFSTDAAVLFYWRLDELLGARGGEMVWAHNPVLCVRALRRYAEKYHSPERVEIPEE